jgi:SAM-dependent methyltransferase
VDIIRYSIRRLLSFALIALVASSPAYAQQAQEPFTPTVGQAGKDVVWVPTPDSLVQKMLDMAKVTPQDVVMDLGSGDGRMIIAAARRGATAIGVEFNPDMVALSRRNAQEAGVGDKATFIEGDMYTADISKASVMALFLLTTNLDKLAPKFLELKPGSRIVLNTFGVTGWTPDATERIEDDCTSWCTAMLYIVPAKVEGKWKLADGEITFDQDFQMVTGTLASNGKSLALQNGRLKGEEISFAVDGVEYTGRVNGTSIEGTTKSASGQSTWKAQRAAN